jgi:hypothetical protein
MAEFTKAKKEKWLLAYAEHGTCKAACEHVKIETSTAYRARQRDADFAERWDALEHATTKILEETAYERAINGSDRLAEFMLKARRPDRYRESLKLEHGGKITAQIDVGISDEIARVAEQLDTATRRLAELADGRPDPAAGPDAPRALASGGEPGPNGAG